MDGLEELAAALDWAKRAHKPGANIGRAEEIIEAYRCVHGPESFDGVRFSTLGIDARAHVVRFIAEGRLTLKNGVIAKV